MIVYKLDTCHKIRDVGFSQIKLCTFPTFYIFY